MPRQSLTLVAQPPELPQLDLAQGRPAAEEQRHAFVTIVSRIAKLAVVEPCEVLRQVRDDLERRHSAPPRAGAVRRFVRAPRSLPSHFRILADKLRVTCMSTSLPPPSAQWPVRSTRKERFGERHGSRNALTLEVERPFGARAPRGSGGHTSAPRSTVSSWKTLSVRCSSSSAIRARPPSRFPTAFRRSTSGALFESELVRPRRTNPGKTVVASRSVGARPHVLRTHVPWSRGNRPRTAHVSLGLTCAGAPEGSRSRASDG